VKVVVAVRRYYYLPGKNSSTRFANRELHTTVK
jgi:hypothetical protein